MELFENFQQKYIIFKLLPHTGEAAMGNLVGYTPFKKVFLYNHRLILTIPVGKVR